MSSVTVSLSPHFLVKGGVFSLMYSVYYVLFYLVRNYPNFTSTLKYSWGKYLSWNEVRTADRHPRSRVQVYSESGDSRRQFCAVQRSAVPSAVNSQSPVYPSL
jgi:hypothetical protein